MSKLIKPDELLLSHIYGIVYELVESAHWSFSISLFRKSHLAAAHACGRAFLSYPLNLGQIWERKEWTMARIVLTASRISRFSLPTDTSVVLVCLCVCLHVVFVRMYTILQCAHSHRFHWVNIYISVVCMCGRLETRTILFATDCGVFGHESRVVRAKNELSQQFPNRIWVWFRRGDRMRDVWFLVNLRSRTRFRLFVKYTL